MSFGEYIDQRIRKSFFGARLSQFRSSCPGLYKGLRSCYEKMFLYHTAGELSRYQRRALNQFNQAVPANLRSGILLEVGSDLDAKVIKELKGFGWSRVIGINPEFDEGTLNGINAALPKGCELRKGDIRTTGLPDGSVGALFSVSVFEHLNDFDICLSEMSRLLVPGGYVYAEFGPIWSSSLGHHVCAIVGDEEARHWDPTRNPVPNYAHLLLKKEEMLQCLKGRASDALADEIVKWIYEKPYINRLLWEDYQRLLNDSDLEVVSIDFDREHVPSGTLDQLRDKYPGYGMFEIKNVRLVLRKNK